MYWIYFLLLIFTYYFFIVSGLISALILRVFKSIFLKRESLFRLKLERELRDGNENDGLSKSKVNVINVKILVEDLFIGVIRGGIITLISWYVLSLFFEVDTQIFLITLLLAQLIITFKNWKRNVRFIDECMRWVGDFPGIIMTFYILIEK
ncbi:hypothetical protein [Cyclobacterium amurskyense]|uniref:Uncharacterized protein n=1 Tax=Cyclobacterium amurskyense TaxID=320787 RepID=A0A0H4PI57_9BACT|nr:hypothetical protein [Cyclobacterium amurskyense]AKP52730.1 hypothetical protein CA2015_3340 [Cyclobacterium amurskyense]